MENTGKCNQEHNAKLMDNVSAQCIRQGVICVQHSGDVGGSSSSVNNNNNNNNCSMKMFENDLQQQQQQHKPQQQHQHQLQQVYKIAEPQQHHERGGIEQQQKQQHNELYATREPSQRESSNSSVHNLRENSGCCGERVCSASDTTTSPKAISTAATTSNSGGGSSGGCDGNEDSSNTAMACAARVEDEGGGATNDDNNTPALKLNGSGTMAAFPAMTHRPHHTHTQCAAAVTVVHLELPTSDAATCYAAGAAADPTDDYEEEAACALGAISLTPPPPHLATPGGGGGGNHSNRTSLNNSTENLSYSSDNYYPDDLILLDDEDVDAEEILSLNSDDCVYAYRGEGAEFDLAMQAIAGRSGAIGVMGADSGLVDDETDFLEMDFEPDPPSEVEYGLQQHAAAEAYCMQRDLCHLSGRHSANMMSAPASSASLVPGGGGGSLQQQRRLFSSPIDREDISCAGSGVGGGNDDDDDDDLLVCSSGPKSGLQSQLLMSKNFARITMHLDQIKGEAADCELSYEHRTPNERSLSGSSRERDLDRLTPSETSHSLPNTLLTDYHRGDSRHAPEHETKTSPSKITGAKPKRLSTHSTSSSQSSKNSSKSRTSLRSSAFPGNGGGCGGGSSGVAGNSLAGHFDERSVSCTEFRSIPPLSSAAIGPSSISVDADECGGVGLPLVVVGKPLAKNHQDDFSSYEEGCLDCLENEFLAKTIGKIMDPKGCPRCQRRRNFSSYPQPMQMFPTRGDFVQRRHSKSFMDSMPVSEQIFYPSQARAMGPVASAGGCDADIMASMGGGNVVVAGCGSGGYRRKKKDFPLAKKVVHVVDLQQTCGGGACDDKTTSIENDPYNYYKADQRRTICDTYNEQLLQSLLLTEPEIATISTININEDTLVQALDNFNITYNADLLRANFKHYYASAAHPQSRNKDFKDMKHFLLHESKKYNNHPRLKRLIEMATGEQVNVDFQRDTNIVDTEMVFVKVSDVIYQWSRNKNLEVLKELDKRFADTNVLGKIANIIRQTQQRCSRSRPFPEFISIPQYYPSGFLTLTKKC